MKSRFKLSMLGLVFFILASCAMQTVTFTESENYVQVYEDVTGDKNSLYLKANDWMISNFNDATSVIQHSDKEEGVLIGKYLMSGTMQGSRYGTADSRVYAIIDIRVKDQKARIEIKPIGSWTYDPNGMTIFQYSKDKAKADMKILAESFHQSLIKKGVEF